MSAKLKNRFKNRKVVKKLSETTFYNHWFTAEDFRASVVSVLARYERKRNSPLKNILFEITNPN